MSQQDQPAQHGPRLRRFSERRQMHRLREPIRSEMLWFVNACEDRSQPIGLHCRREDGFYALTVVDADGSETRTTFHDEDAMVAEAVRLQLDLESRGWRALPRTT